MKGDTNPPLASKLVLPSPLPGNPHLRVHLDADAITAIDYLWHAQLSTNSQKPTFAVSLLERYFQGEEPLRLEQWLRPAGTPFQLRVWERLQQIPPGEVKTYGALARELGSFARAVAGACRANPIPILIPCHRVIAATGYGGYLGKTGGKELAIKQWLLQHEDYV